MVAIGVSAQLMLDLMRLKIRDLADLQHAVLCHGGRLRQLASGVVFFRIGQQNADVADDAAHDGLIDIIGEVVFIRLAEVGFHRVAQRVERAGDDLAAVGHAAAAHGEDQVDVIFTRQLRAILHLGISGVRHDTGELHDALACGIQDTHDLIVHAVALDETAAIGQHDGFAKVCEQAAEVLLHAAFAEIYLGLVFKNKVIHHNASSLTVFLAVFAAVCYHCRWQLPVDTADYKYRL